MKLIRGFLILLLSAQLISCGKSEKQMAAGRLQLAESLYEKGDTAQALAHADSIRILYRGAVQEINTADQFKRKIYGDLLYRKQDELDTLNKTIAGLEKNFITGKTEFDRYTRYIHRKQDPERRWNKSFIQVHLDGQGDLSISSNYYGETWLNHTGIRVYDGDLQAKTDTVGLGNVLNHHSDFLNTKWEKVTYMHGADKGVIDFIVRHADRKLKAVFLGKRYYYIILEEYDKQAIADGLNLSRALKRRVVLEKEIKALQSKAG
jgi:hypothetical protein